MVALTCEFHCGVVGCVRLPSSRRGGESAWTEQLNLDLVLSLLCMHAFAVIRMHHESNEEFGSSHLFLCLLCHSQFRQRALLSPILLDFLWEQQQYVPQERRLLQTLMVRFGLLTPLMLNSSSSDGTNGQIRE